MKSIRKKKMAHELDLNSFFLRDELHLNEDGTLCQSEHCQDEPEIKPSRFSFLKLPLFQWKTFLAFVLISTIVFMQWYLSSELFKLPQDVMASRESYFHTKHRFEKTRSYWDIKARQFTDIISTELRYTDLEKILSTPKDTSFELWMALAMEKFCHVFERDESLAIFFRQGKIPGSLILSKYDSEIWPMRILLSMEIDVKVQGNLVIVSVKRLRRGAEDIAPGLCWAYFGKELETLRNFKINPIQLTLLQ